MFKNNRVEKFSDSNTDFTSNVTYKMLKCDSKCIENKADDGSIYGECTVIDEIGKTRTRYCISKKEIDETCKLDKFRSESDICPIGQVKDNDNMITIKDSYSISSESGETYLSMDVLEKEKKFKNKSKTQIALMIMNSKIYYTDKKITVYPRESKHGTLPYTNEFYVNFKTEEEKHYGNKSSGEVEIIIHLNENNKKITRVTRKKKSDFTWNLPANYLGSGPEWIPITQTTGKPSKSLNSNDCGLYAQHINKNYQSQWPQENEPPGCVYVTNDKYPAVYYNTNKSATGNCTEERPCVIYKEE